MCIRTHERKRERERERERGECCFGALYCSEVGPLSSYILRLQYPRMDSLPHWEQQLYSAQSVLFNKELLTKVNTAEDHLLACSTFEHDGTSSCVVFIICCTYVLLLVVLWDVPHQALGPAF